MTKRILEKLGLSGEAIMPLVLGFGCKTMATMTTRTLRSPKERCIAIYLIAFAIPCAAQTGINMSILGRIGIAAFILVFAMLALAEIISGLILNRILKAENRCEFFHELPAMRLPNLKGIVVKTWYRLYWFVQEAVPVFVYAAVTLLVLDKSGILNQLRKPLGLLFKAFLGLPLAMVDAVILCLIRREAAAGPIINLIKKGELDYVQCIIAVIITTMFVPCFANTMTIIREVGPKRALIMVTAINVSALLIAGTLHWTLTTLVKL
jgi:ferrous iron transport protein B